MLCSHLINGPIPYIVFDREVVTKSTTLVLQQFLLHQRARVVKRVHEIRDPIHAFIRLDADERKVLDSRPFQRLRHISQLALTSLVYPGATHRRFEHSLGVMELAGRVYDVVTDPDNIFQDVVRDIVPRHRSLEHQYWRRVVRMAALCHDIGHLPFSHAAEKELLPKGWSHEDLTISLIKSDEMSQIWERMTPPLKATDIAKLAVGPKKINKRQKLDFSIWDAILSEIIVGDVFGVDRIDYLLRDSLHSGVEYGRFDYYRLIDTLRILPKQEDSEEPVLGIEDGGLHAAEALLQARYFMFTQVYYHPIRRIYDIHLKDFLLKHFGRRGYPTKVEKHLSNTDNDILVELVIAARDPSHKAHDPARRIVERDHFRLVYKRDPSDFKKNPEASSQIYEALGKKYRKKNVRFDEHTQTGGPQNFPVWVDNKIISSIELSETLEKTPVAKVEYVFIEQELKEKAKKFISANHDQLIAPKPEE